MDPLERVKRLAQERDLYLGMLNLGQVRDIDTFLGRALSLIVNASGAEQGYVELFDSEEPAVPECHAAVGFTSEDVQAIRQAVSRGIIAESVASGNTIVTPSALLDPRFRDRQSVKRSQIQAVLCTPIGSDPPLGVLYLHSHSGTLDFDPEIVRRAETFTRHLAPLARDLRQRHLKNRFVDCTGDTRSRLRVEGFVGTGKAAARLLSEIELVAPLDLCVLITGETGTGKSQLARLLHDNSPRSRGPFVEVNCATIPEALVESELFGALPGAHSTATRRIDGKVAAAGSGTLVLDEIAELSVAAQAKLLQLLQTKEYFPLGAARPLRAGARICAISNTDLRAAVAEKRFREDLFYRLQVLPIEVPPLSGRTEDIVVLSQHFCAVAQQSHRLSRLSLSSAALKALSARRFPGNIRELQNLVEAGTIRAAAEHATSVEPVHLFGESAPVDPSREIGTFQEETRRFQRDLLNRTLMITDFNVAATARQLDLTRSHVYNLIKVFGLALDGKR